MNHVHLSRFHPQRSVSSAGSVHPGPHPDVQRPATFRANQTARSSGRTFHVRMGKTVAQRRRGDRAENAESPHPPRNRTTCTSRGSTRSAPSPQPGRFTLVPTRTYNVRPLSEPIKPASPSGRTFHVRVGRTVAQRRRGDGDENAESLHPPRNRTPCTSRGSTRNAPSPQPGRFTLVPTRTYNVRPLSEAIKPRGQVAERFTFGWAKPSHRDAEETEPKTPNHCTHPGTEPPAPLAVPPATLRLLSRVGSPWSPPGRTTSSQFQSRSNREAKVAERFTFGWARPSHGDAEETEPKASNHRTHPGTEPLAPLAVPPATLRLLSRVGSPWSPPGRTTSGHFRRQSNREVQVAERFTFGWARPSHRDAEETETKASNHRTHPENEPRAPLAVPPATLRLLSRVGSPWSPPGRTTSGHFQSQSNPQAQVAERFTFGWAGPSHRDAEETETKASNHRTHPENEPPAPFAVPPAALRLLSPVTSTERVGLFPARLSPKKAVDAPGAGSVGREKQEDEAEQHGRLTVVLDGPGSVGLMELKVRHRHLSRQNQRHRSGEQTQQDRRPPVELQDSADPGLRQHRRMPAELHRDAAEPVEDLHRTRLEKQQPRHDAQQEDRDHRCPIPVHHLTSSTRDGAHMHPTVLPFP